MTITRNCGCEAEITPNGTKITKRCHKHLFVKTIEEWDEVPIKNSLRFKTKTY